MPARAAEAVADDCAVRSWVAGTVDLCNGTLVYRDYVFDDWGADRGEVLPRVEPQPNGSPWTAAGALPPAGDDRYPSATDANTADLVALSLWVRGDRLHVQFEMDALFRPDSTVAALAIDTDDDPSTGGGPWPGVSGVQSRGWELVERFTTGDPAANVLEASIPLPAGDQWRVQAVTGIAGGPVMNVAFRGPDEYGFWWDERQAAALRAGDVSAFGHSLSVDDLREGATRRAPDPGPGMRQRVYVSRYTLPPGEGVSQEGVAGPGGGTAGVFGHLYHFLGKYQPYGVYVPDEPGPHGVQLALHGYLENHSGRIWFVTHGGANARAQLGEARNRIIVTPLGRGWSGWYTDLSERDVIDVLDDVEASYDVDRDAVFAGGLSMGGYGAYRLASLFPDRFAGLITWLGYTGDCYNGTPAQGGCDSDGTKDNALDLFGNLRHVPTAMVYVGNDELVHANQAVAARERFQALSYRHAWYFYPVGGHTLWTFLDEWGKESAWSADVRRVRSPARVTFRTDRALDAPDLDIVHDRAYWVSDIRQRDDGWADVDVTSFGCGVDVPRTEAVRGAGATPVPWVSEGLDVVGHARVPPQQRLEATLANVASLTVDVRPACLKAFPLAYRITTDGPATVTLSDGRELALPSAGTHEGKLTAATVLGAAITPLESGRSDPGGTTGSLPATGRASTALAGLALLAGALAVRRCATARRGVGAPGGAAKPPVNQ